MLKLHGEHCQTKSNSICMYILLLTWMLSKLYKMSKNPQCPDKFSFVILVTILKMVCVAEKSKSLCQLCCNQILTQVSSSLCYSQMVTVLLWCFLHACFSFREIPGKDISKKSSLQSRWKGPFQRLLVKPVPPSVRELTPDPAALSEEANPPEWSGTPSLTPIFVWPGREAADISK